jgi:hypothetical protein
MWYRFFGGCLTFLTQLPVRSRETRFPSILPQLEMNQARLLGVKAKLPTLRLTCCLAFEHVESCISSTMMGVSFFLLDRRCQVDEFRRQELEQEEMQLVSDWIIFIFFHKSNCCNSGTNMTKIVQAVVTCSVADTVSSL